ncbi:Arf-GAP with coiled-coil, ANK repeat and PH domain-containing protein isoform 2 [Schistosoma japonicum]|uniref:Arf-GAP with coiled-coil, ANK repeat and PH domain-containing protein isoform 2 n=1 Tax=Schistosoma japonicum TaxID=6182 RepID=A0A4Z2D0M3_SCHJA|nr:Arf-GAP with coiled-coil, ANK repeat and PH domain-containing protein 2 [Schistosoma japonicum]TNN10055.1 Arf-GAP with coiled-coil, ANK repeat and PH domain-containing protein isoform 2 [Schistosoma japonicum]
MSTSIECIKCFDDTSANFDDLIFKFSSPLPKFGAFSDTPELHQTLAHAELTICGIRAYYNLIQEICRQSVTLAKCIGLGLDQKQLLLFNATLPKELDHLNTQKIFNHAAHLTSLFAEQTRKLATKISDIEQILSKSNDSLNKFYDLRTNFQRAHEHLDNAINHAASASATRSSMDLHVFDNQVKEAKAIYQTTETLYLSHIRQIIGPNYIISYLQLIVLVLSVQQSFAEQLNLMLDNSGKTNSLTSSMLVKQCKKLITSIEQKTNTEISSEIKLSETPAVEAKSVTSLDDLSNPRLEGYLFKRSGRKGWRTWARRWFRVHGNQLVYCKLFHGLTSADLKSASDTTFSELNQKVCTLSLNTDRLTNGVVNKQSESGLLKQLLRQADPQWTVMETDLRFCTARNVQPNKRYTAGEKPIHLLNNSTDRRFVFELISSRHRTYYLQAISANELDIWVNTLRSGFHDICQTNKPYYLKNGIMKGSFISNSLDLLASRSPTQISLDFSNSPTASSVSGFPSRKNDPLNQVSHSSVSDQDGLQNNCGTLLWREPDLAGNRLCADCAVGDAKWASINLGVTLCMLCAAVHRSLGVHISKVRSLTLDNWQPELLHVMLNLGNKFVNKILEFNWQLYASEFPRLSLNTPFEQRKAWIEAKWVRFKFARLPLPLEEVSDSLEAVQWIRHLYDSWQQRCVQIRQDFPELISHPLSSSSPSVCASNSPEKKLSRYDIYRYTLLDELINTIKNLHERNKLNIKREPRGQSKFIEQKTAAEHLVCFGAQLGCPLLILSGLTGGASPDATLKVNGTSTTTRNSYPALILASRIGCIAACEFLLLNGADIDIKDDRGRTPLHHACRFGRVHLVCLLLRRRANQMITDNDGKSPLDVALEVANADIVTLLRLQRLDETAKNSDFTLNDETVIDVFHDFTLRTYYLNCDDNVTDNEDDTNNDDDDYGQIICTNLKSCDFSQPYPSTHLPKPEVTYVTDKIIKIRPNYEIDSSIQHGSSSSGSISSSGGSIYTINTTNVATTTATSSSINNEIIIINPSNKLSVTTSPCGLGGAVDIRRRRIRNKKHPDFTDKT